MFARLTRFPSVLFLVVAVVLIFAGGLRAEQAPAPLAVKGLDARTVPLDGLWQFHLGDEEPWSDPSFDDSNAELLSADRPWGLQGHANYSGYAWYRRHIEFSAGEAQPIAILIPHVDDAYELYWNGKLVGRNGKLPPFPRWPEQSQPPQIYQLGPAQNGVLALRVWKSPPLSDDSGEGGGFEAAPLLGTPEAIATHKALMDYQWLRGRQFQFAVDLLYGLVGLVSLLAWLRDRRQWPLFWMAGFTLARVVQTIFYGVRLPWSLVVANCVWQPISSLRDISLWFLLLWLLELRENRKLVRLIKIAAWISIGSTLLDAPPFFLDWIPGLQAPLQILDAAMTGLYVLTAAVPLILVGAAVRGQKRLDASRWAVAIFAFLSGMIQAAEGILPQGQRFTHWTLANKLNGPIVTVHGNAISLALLTGILLLAAIVYAVLRNADESQQRQNAMEQELQSARALQQVLIPETLPELSGFALRGAYRPAAEVGGDFFQIIPLEGEWAGSTLVILGDVSGKGLKAAMAASFIVGAIRALANLVHGPAALLAELNTRLFGRMQGGFATCIALQIDSRGGARVASAGHPAPFLNQNEMELPGAMPLGMEPSVQYEEFAVQLRPGDHCTLYTDGVLEARNSAGALYGFERLATMLRRRPDAVHAAEAAVSFGQDDDITVVTLTRLETNESSTMLSAPHRILAADLGNSAGVSGS